MWSLTVEYALRAVMCLARSASGKMTTPEIAARTAVPAGYLSKVLQLLVRAGVLRSQRGLHGGFQLNGPAESITLLAVVEAVSPIERIEHCPLTAEESGELCSLHRCLDDALGLVEQVLQSTTLATLLASHPPPDSPPPGLTDTCRRCFRHRAAESAPEPPADARR